MSARPDGYSFIPEAEIGENIYAAIADRMEKWRPEMSWARFTDLTGPHAVPHMEPGIWIEVWRQRPDQDPEFDPPMTAKRQ